MIAPDLAPLTRPIKGLKLLKRNARRGDIDAIARSYARFGQRKPIVARRDGTVIAGNHQLQAAKKLGWTEIAVVYVDDDDQTATAYSLADNRTSELGGYDDTDLAELLASLDDMDGTGYTANDLTSLLSAVATPTDDTPPAPSPALTDRFVIPPFTVLDARSGPWQERKRRWLTLGIRSEEGRGEADDADALTLQSLSGRIPDYYAQKTAAEKRVGRALSASEFEAEHLVIPTGTATLSTSGTSIFDPVLCELIYRWYSPPGGHVLDPFSGGSVRGVVAGLLGRNYTGIDLRAEQVKANREQWQSIMPREATAVTVPEVTTSEPHDLTPVQRVGDVWVKRDDLFVIGGSRGGKVRACSLIIEQALSRGAVPGLITAGSRQSPQVNIVATLAQFHGLPCRVHVPSGKKTPEILAAEGSGAEVVAHTPGHNTVIVSRARKDAKASGWLEIPFGMEHPVAIQATSAQVANIPKKATRIVVPVGSGMALAGILHGLRQAGRSVPVVGVQVGADPTARLDAYAPAGWRSMVTLVSSGVDYHTPAPVTMLDDIRLDPIYEAKCLPFLQPGDTLWIVGRRETAAESVVTEVGEVSWIEGDSTRQDTLLPAGEQYDLVFTCPPYADLEVYSSDPADISTMSYPQFLTAYRSIIADATSRLRRDRFAAIVVGDIRDKKGNYRNFVGDTVQAFLDAGLAYYNEAILVTPIGSLAVRTPRQFIAGRKMGKTHQNVLIFVKGDGKRATQACGPITVDLPDDVRQEEDDDRAA